MIGKTFCHYFILSFRICFIIINRAMCLQKIVNDGQFVEFPCFHNRTNLKYLRWSYIPYNKVRHVDLYDLTNDEFRDNYEASCRSDQPSCNLKLLSAKKESAGRYSCKVVDELEKKTIEVSSTQLVVGSLKCSSNIGENGQLIGENDCKGIQPDKINISCSFEYYGHLNQTVNLILKEKYNNGTRIIEKHSIKSDVINLMSIQDNIQVNTNMNEMSFKCEIQEFPEIVPCDLPQFNVLFVKSIHLTSSPQPTNIPNDVTCSVNKSSNINCSCTWSHNLGMAQTQIHGCNLPEINRKQPGIYICNVKCQLSAAKECSIEAMQFSVPESFTEASLTMFLNIALVFLHLVILAIIALWIINRYRKRSKLKTNDTAATLLRNPFQTVEEDALYAQKNIITKEDTAQLTDDKFTPIAETHFVYSKKNSLEKC